jgi:hypothetical protein
MGTIIGGLAMLFGLALLIAHALDRQARTEAWKRIATLRKINSDWARALEEIEFALQVRGENLDQRERQLNRREHMLDERECLLERREQQLRHDDGNGDDDGAAESSPRIA